MADSDQQVFVVRSCVYVQLIRSQRDTAGSAMRKFFERNLVPWKPVLVGREEAGKGILAACRQCQFLGPPAYDVVNLKIPPLPPRYVVIPWPSDVLVGKELLDDVIGVYGLFGINHLVSIGMSRVGQRKQSVIFAEDFALPLAPDGVELVHQGHLELVPAIQVFEPEVRIFLELRVIARHISQQASHLIISHFLVAEHELCQNDSIGVNM
mmetsp:Transcript_26905/g.63839  ORF Transcript_26905/g.63839 Transcript_26905/m.63839 type:complete len:210 (-) Transcript_26905:946-1575(-)